MGLLFYIIKIKLVLFSKLMLCLLSKFLLHKTSGKKKALFQKVMHEKRCAVVKSYGWPMEKEICWENYYLTQPEILCPFLRMK